ncbi:dihydroorotate dehydrogenase [Longimycelium tulufanense]|nr:dihydroorotate dehydrogenase [Longimycelium tulufanense]
MAEGRARCRALGMTLSSPVVVGSGLLTDQERNIRRLLERGAGAVVTKTIHPSPPRIGDERVLRLPTGMLNSTTYSRRSVDDWCAMLARFAQDGLPVIASVHANSPAELGTLAQRVAETGCRALELGISCMNEEEGLDDTPGRVAAHVQAVRELTSLPFSVKLAVGERTRDRVLAALEAGADAITLSDTIAGLAVDPVTGEVRLGGAFGYSGAGIKPLVLAEIFALRQRGVEAPILGGGGVQHASDVVEYLSVGANVVQVYTALHKNMHETFAAIQNGVAAWLRSHDTTVDSLVGRSLPKRG